ncbi:M20/M25/M40 family metallo-hydrolase [Lentiprolixibacter aurantiacus]|uniref:M20/M25/M40 family metallo-hydrolase n=1 Tax=Lentiprolixibacter aurantiacus TaxID=2993939 RepID=A0AAE3MKH2_9FLAO|nr:M20/M25/M40 family metallo-hydrolase [Lentiprolixibacter aurantiacus]MCX2719306.1 M20/M25/M40 family metallo-hydrolase [Lentiprolixibacter aurantiacus]
MKKYLALFMQFMLLGLWAQEQGEMKTQIRHTIDEIREFVRIPNDALDGADINRNITWLTKKFSERGFNTTTLPTSGQPLFFAALPITDEKPTLLFYMHFDGQSVDPGKWRQPDPYEVVLRAPADSGWEDRNFDELKDSIPSEWRLFGRSTADDKGPIVMFLNAIDLIKKKEDKLPFNVKVILDGEEEKGSNPLAKAVKEYRELLQADYLIINDGPVHTSGLPTVVYGCRGITTLTLTAYGPVKPQHSGHYGNYAPNPALELSRLLSGMKDKDGKVIIPGYYDGIALDEETRNILQSVPDDIAHIHEMLQISEPEKVGGFYQEALQYPSLNIRGLSAGWVGDKVRTIVPATATAELDLRLVPESDGTRLKKLVRDHIKQQGYFITDTEPDSEMRKKHPRIIRIEERGVTDAFRTSLRDPFGNHLVQLLSDSFNEHVVQIRIMGGTVPIAPFINELEIPAFILPLVNPDNNQHSPDENLRIGQIGYGIQVFHKLLTTAAD